MLRTIAWYTHFAVSLLLKTPEMFRVKNMIKDGKNPEAIEYIEKTTRRLALSQMKLSGERVKIYG